MMSSYSLLSIAKLLLIASLFFSCLLVAIPHNTFASLKYERRSVSTEINIPSKQPPARGVEKEIRQGKRGFGLGTASDTTSSDIESLIGTVASLETGQASNLNSSAPPMSSSGMEYSGSMPFLITDEPILILTTQSVPTSSDIAALAGILEGLLNGANTLTTSSIVSEVASGGEAVAAPIQAIATDILSAENRVEANDLQALEAQHTVESLFEGLNSAIDSIIGDITKGAVSDLLVPTLEGSSKVASSGLGNMAEVTDRPGSLANNSIEDDACGIITVVDGVPTTIAGHCRSMTLDASIMLEASETTIFPVPTTSAPVSTAATSLTTLLTTASISGAPQTITPPIITTRSVVGSISKGTIVGATAAEDCPSTMTSTIFLAGETSTSTVYVYQPCPTIPPCPTCPPPTCHCPMAPPTTTPFPLEGNGPQGPCPGSGYSCHDCIDGWFCPPSQTPAQPAPCGFGWPCAHCYGGWFCVPHPTPTASPDTCESIESNTNSPESTSTTTSLPSTPLPGTISPPRSTQPAGTGNPKSPGGASGWGYCGCWADEPDHRALNMESALPNLGPLTNKNCVQHCLGRGFLMAGTENGRDCYCGNFLNGTQKLDDSVCSTPCTGDPNQACGGHNALTCYSSDNEAHGWASVGVQPLPATVSPPEVMSMVIGGVARTVVTEPASVFPQSGADMSQLISQYGKKTQQPEGQMPDSMGTNSAPSGNGSPALGGPTSFDTCQDSTLGPSTIPGSDQNGDSSAGLTSPGSNNGNTGLSSNRSPSNPNGGSGASPTTPGANPTASPNRNTSPTPTGSAAVNSGVHPGSASNGNGGPTPGQTNGASSAANGGAGINPTSGPNSNSSPNNGAGTNPTMSGGNPDSPTPSPVGGGLSASPTGPNEEGQGTTSASNGESGGSTPCVPGSDSDCVSVGSSGGQTQPSSGLGQETAGLNPNGNSSGNGGSPGKTSPGQDQGTAASNPTGNLSANSGHTGQSSSGQGQGATNPSSNGNNPGQTSVGGGQGTATPSPSSNPSQPSSGQGQGQGTAAPAGNSANPSQTSPGIGQGTASPNPTENPPANGGNSDQGTTVPNPTNNLSGHPSQTLPTQGQGTAGPSSGGADSGQNQPTGLNPSAGTITCGLGPTDPPCTSPNNGGGSGSGGQGQGTQSNLGGNNGNSPITPGSNPISNPSGNGGHTPGTQGLGTPSNSNGGGGGSMVTSPGPNPNSNPTGINRDSTLTGGNGPTTSNPDAGGASPNPMSGNPQTPSFTFPPGQGPYGDRPPPSMITLKSMIAWTEPDDKEGPPTVMLRHRMSSRREPLSTPDLEFGEPLTTTTDTPIQADPQWQRIHPVVIW